MSLLSGISSGSSNGGASTSKTGGGTTLSFGTSAKSTSTVGTPAKSGGTTVSAGSVATSAKTSVSSGSTGKIATTLSGIAGTSAKSTSTVGTPAKSGGTTVSAGVGNSSKISTVSKTPSATGNLSKTPSGGSNSVVSNSNNGWSFTNTTGDPTMVESWDSQSKKTITNNNNNNNSTTINTSKTGTFTGIMTKPVVENATVGSKQNQQSIKINGSSMNSNNGWSVTNTAGDPTMAESWDTKKNANPSNDYNGWSVTNTAGDPTMVESWDTQKLKSTPTKTLNQATVDNMKKISDVAIADLGSNKSDAEIRATIEKMVDGNIITKGGQSKAATVNEAIAYYKFVQGDESQVGDVSQFGPAAENIKTLTIEAAKDRGKNLTDAEINSKITKMLNDGTLKNDRTDATLNEAIAYYKYAKDGTPFPTSTTPNNPTNPTNPNPGGSGDGNDGGGVTLPSWLNQQNNNQQQSTVKIDEEAVNNLINRIRKAAEDLDSYWSYIKNNCMEKVKNSWAANETQSYVDTVLAEDGNVTRIKDSLLLLAKNYEQVRDQGIATQQQNAQYINNIAGTI